MDIIHRQWEILKILDIEPYFKTKRQIMEGLVDKGYNVSEKTIIRDLGVLAIHFGIKYKNNKIAYSKEGIKPFITSDSAFAFNLVEKVLANIIPEKAIPIIAPYFKVYKDQNKDTESLNTISSKVEFIYSSPLLPPEIKEHILSDIYIAVLNEIKVNIKYSKDGWEKKKIYTLNSLGIVIKDQHIYFICQEHNKELIMYLPVQRIKEVELLVEKSNIPKSFNLKEYADKNINKWNIDDNSDLLDFKAEFDQGIAFIVKETPIAKNQAITKKENGNFIIEAKVNDSMHFRYWLLSLGDQVKVIKPKILRTYFKDIATNLANMYRV